MKTTRMPGHTIAALFFALLTAAGCDAAGENEDVHVGGAAVYVGNQGNFGDGNGSVTIYDPETGNSRPNAVSGLASIVQSLQLVGGELYVMANSANRIDVFDAETLERTGQIAEVTSPRYMVVDGPTAYVTNLFDAPDTFSGGRVSVVDLAAEQKITEIDVGDNPEGLALAGSRLYVANHGFGSGSTLHVIDTSSRAVADTIDVACDGPRTLANDGDGDIFVFCTGRTIFEGTEVVGRTNGAIRVLDGETGEIVARIDLDGWIGTAGPGQDAFLSEEATLAFAVKEERTVLLFDTITHAAVGEIGPLEGPAIGAVAYDASSQRLYLGRSNGFTQAGEVTLHSADGTELGRFLAGIAPAYITFAAEE